MRGRATPLAILMLGCSALAAWGILHARSPNDQRASSVAAALAQQSVHFRIERWENTGPDAYSSGVVEAHSGKERLRSGAENAWVRLLARTVYFKGNRSALTQILRLSAARAKEYVGRWISIPRRGAERGLYQSLATNLTLVGLIRGAVPRWSVGQVNPQNAGGHQRVLLVARRGESSAGLIVDEYGPRLPWALFVDRRYGNPLPSGYFPQQAHLAGHLFEWNRPVILAMPAHSTPIATVRKS